MSPPQRISRGYLQHNQCAAELEHRSGRVELLERLLMEMRTKVSQLEETLNGKANGDSVAYLME